MVSQITYDHFHSALICTYHTNPAIVENNSVKI
jgi:hypothetical protein